jgi:hypothetical protein
MASLLDFVRLLAAAERLATADAGSIPKALSNEGSDQAARTGSSGPRPATNHERLEVFLLELQTNLQEVGVLHHELLLLLLSCVPPNHPFVLNQPTLLF